VVSRLMASVVVCSSWDDEVQMPLAGGVKAKAPKPVPGASNQWIIITCLFLLTSWIFYSGGYAAV
jgi:hypothetical protein